MKLTKEGQRVWNNLKKKGYSDQEIAESYILPMEYESEEEKKEDEQALKNAITKVRKENEQNRKKESEDK